MFVVNKGKSSHLMKVGTKRRRSKLEIKEQMEGEERERQDIQDKLAAWDDVERELEEKTQQVELAQLQFAEVTKLFESGLLKRGAHGAYEVVQDPRERAQIKQEISSKSKLRLPTKVAESQDRSALDEGGLE